MSSLYETVQKIVRGDIIDLPKTRSKIVRIFLSSTFTDTHEERDYLIENIYPKLRDYCKNEHGLDFQIVDMRWGIPNETSNDHSTTSICLTEIENCQNLSLGPNFIVFLSHKYGTRMLPTNILDSEFEILKQEINSSDNNRYIDLLKYENKENNLKLDNILDYCYKKDENVTPNRYCLLSKNKLIPINSDNNWDELQVKLSVLLRKVANACFKKEKITSEQKLNYYASVTEKEVIEGILKSTNIDDNVLVFIREINDIETSEVINSNKSLARRFIDLDNDGNIDLEAKELLDDLKRRIREKVPEANMHIFNNIKWNSKSGGVTRDDNGDYLKLFGEKFFESVKKLIDMNARKSDLLKEINVYDHNLIAEVLNHARFSLECVEKFQGRSDLVEKIRLYISSESHKALFIYGNPGCGKTSLIARIVYDLSSEVRNQGNLISVFRFMGTTPDTSNILNTIKSVIKQLNVIFKRENKELLNIKNNDEIRAKFTEYLESLELEKFNKRLVICFDSIDQLIIEDQNSLNWLVFNLPRNVKIIYSTLFEAEKNEEILRKIKEFELNDDQFIGIQGIDIKLANEILDDWLFKENRRLSKEQWEVINCMFKEATLYPLYVKLIFDLVIKWTSYHMPEENFKKNLNMNKCIEYLYKRLEHKYGSKLIKHLMMYISELENGISELEIEDLLSIDDTVLYELFEFHEPPVRKFPIVIWSRIKADLKEYLVEKEIHETKVISWYHRQFLRVANSLYYEKLSNYETIIQINIIDYFNEKWRFKAKPYKVSGHVKKKRNLTADELKAVRYTAEQKTLFKSQDGIKRWNIRKIYYLSSLSNRSICNDNESVNLFYKNMIFNYEYLIGKIECMDFAFGRLHSSLNHCFNSEEDTTITQNLNLLKSLFTECLASIVEYPNSAAIQITSRLLVFNGQLDYITELIRQCDGASFRDCAIAAPYQILEEPDFSVNDSLLLRNCSKPIKFSCSDGYSVFLLNDKLNYIENGLLGFQHNLPILNANDEYKGLISYIPSYMYPDKYVFVFSDRTINYYYFERYEIQNNLRIIFDELVINQLLLISTKNYMLSFKGENFIHIYEFGIEKPNDSKIFNQSIKFIANSLNSKNIHSVYDVEKPIFVAVLLENFEIQVFRTLKGSHMIESLIQIPSSGFDCYSFNFYHTGLLCSYVDGSVCQVNFESDSVVSIEKILLPTTKFRIVNTVNESHILIIDEDLNLNLKIDKHLCRITGPYEDAIFLDADNTEHIAATHKDKIDLFRFDLNEKTLSVLKVKQIQNHFDPIVFISSSGYNLLTITLNGFVTNYNKLKLFDPESYKLTDFDYSKNDINFLFEIESSKVGSYSSKSGIIDLWNLENGKIQATFDSHFQYIFDVGYANGVCLIVGLENDNSNKQVSFMGYHEDSKERYHYIFQDIETARVVFNKAKQTFIIACRTLKQTLRIYLVRYNHEWSVKMIDPQGIESDKDILNNICFTSQNMLLAAYQANELIFINIDDNEVVTKSGFHHDIKVNYMSMINQTDDIFFLDNQGQFCLVLNGHSQAFSDPYRLLEVVKFYDKKFKFSKFTHYQNYLCLLNQITNELLVYDLMELKKSKSLDSFQFRIGLKDTKLINFSMNSNYLVTVQSFSLLCVYYLRNGEQVASLPLYNQVLSLHLTDEYVALGMADKRVISYLFVNQDNHGKIKTLESRQLDHTDELKRNKILKYLRRYSNEEKKFSKEELFRNEASVKKDHDEISTNEHQILIKYLRDIIKRIQTLEVDKVSMKLEELNDNWLKKSKSNTEILKHKMPDEKEKNTYDKFNQNQKNSSRACLQM